MIWKLRYAYHFWRLTGSRWSFCWQLANAYCEYVGCEDSPLEAVEVELSYWTD